MNYSLLNNEIIALVDEALSPTQTEMLFFIEQFLQTISLNGEYSLPS
jgi:hypothetical protein